MVRCWRGYLSEVRCKSFAYGPVDAIATRSYLVSLLKSRTVSPLNGCICLFLQCALTLLAERHGWHPACKILLQLPRNVVHPTWSDVGKSYTLCSIMCNHCVFELLVCALYFIVGTVYNVMFWKYLVFANHPWFCTSNVVDLTC